MYDGECCATCKYVNWEYIDCGDINIDVREWHCQKKRIEIDDPYFDKCLDYERKEEKR